jgi:hypothetical protein
MTKRQNSLSIISLVRFKLLCTLSHYDNEHLESIYKLRKQGRVNWENQSL